MYLSGLKLVSVSKYSLYINIWKLLPFLIIFCGLAPIDWKYNIAIIAGVLLFAIFGEYAQMKILFLSFLYTSLNIIFINHHGADKLNIAISLLYSFIIIVLIALTPIFIKKDIFS